MKKTLLTAAVLIAGTLSAAAQTVEEKVDALISQMTLQEKTSLSMHTSMAIPRLGIKQYNWWNEALHGVGRNGSATVFPQPIGMAASFDDALLYDVFTAVSDEARVKHRIAAQRGDLKIYEGLTFWTPNINIFRDPRWGRGMETYGEDPYLTGQLGMAVVRGLQGPDDSPVRKLHACAKHFAVHSGPESTRHSYDAVVSERDLRETYLPAFKDLVVKAKVEEVMTAYNRFRGEPCGASPYLIDTILRGEWGYKGLITSDCWAVDDFFVKGRHNYVETAAEAAALAVHSGVDTECGSAYSHIPEAVEQGLLDERDLDRNLRRLLTARYKLGEMEDIDPWANLPESIVEGPEHRALSLKMAQESIVLLQNKGNILPLKPGKKVALIGPNIDDAEMQWGNYNAVPKSTVTLLQAMKQRIPDIVSFRGCGLVDSEFMPKNNNRRGPDMSNLSEQEMEDMAKRFAIGIAEVKKMAENQRKQNELYLPALDVNSVLAQLEGIETVIFAGGISPKLEGEEMPVTIPGFASGDRTDIELPDVQRRMLKALHDAGKKVIFVNFSGSAMGLVPETESCDAIVQAWYPGQEGGTALANVIMGDVNPSGKLPVTFYRSVSQLSDFEDYDMAGHTYRFFTGKPLYPFGFGLSYTKFNVGKATLKNNTVTIPVKNTGKIDGDQVIQLYVSRPDDAAGPIRTLRAFKRVSVPAGKTVNVTLTLDDETFLWWDEDAQNMIPKHGTYTLEYGTSSDANDLKKLTYKF